MKLSNLDIKEKTKMVIETLVKDENGYEYFYDMLKMFNDDDSLIVKEKMDNLVNLLNDMSDDEYEKFEDLDFEDEIWNMI